MDVRTGRRPVAAKPQNSWGKCVGGGSDAPLARRSLGEGGEDDDKEWRHRRTFSSNALGDRVPPRRPSLTNLLFSCAGVAPVPLRNSDKPRSSAPHSSHKRYTRNCRCMLPRTATESSGIFHRLISFQGPWDVSCKEISATSGFAPPFGRGCVRPTRSSCTRRRR